VTLHYFETGDISDHPQLTIRTFLVELQKLLQKIIVLREIFLSYVLFSPEKVFVVGVSFAQVFHQLLVEGGNLASHPYLVNFARNELRHALPGDQTTLFPPAVEGRHQLHRPIILLVLADGAADVKVWKLSEIFVTTEIELSDTVDTDTNAGEYF
jgi:hypothetical protein